MTFTSIRSAWGLVRCNAMRASPFVFRRPTLDDPFGHFPGTSAWLVKADELLVKVLRLQRLAHRHRVCAEPGALPSSGFLTQRRNIGGLRLNLGFQSRTELGFV